MILGLEVFDMSDIEERTGETGCWVKMCCYLRGAVSSRSNSEIDLTRGDGKYDLDLCLGEKSPLSDS